MHIFNFVTKQEIDELPEDSEAAFMQFVNHASKRLDETYRNASFDNDEGQWQVYHEAKYRYKNIILAAARSYGIEPFASMEVPSLKEFSDADYRQFEFDLDHYLTQILLGSSNKDSVALSDKDKDRIRQYTYNLRNAVEKAQMPQDKREALLKKLDIFETELEKKRISLLEISKISFAIFAAPGAAWSSVDIIHKLTTNILQIVGEAKAEEDEAKRLKTSTQRILVAPRKATEAVLFEDEIPF